MTEEQKEFFRNIGILEEEIQYCYFSTDGKPFTLLKNKEGKMLKTGEQVYKEDYLNPSAPMPTLEERVATLENLQLQQGGLI